MRWRKNADSSYTDLDQAVQFAKMLRHHEQLFVWSCYLYYHLDRPVLSDDSFDHTEKLLERHWDDLSPTFQTRYPKGALKTHASATVCSDEEVTEALAWAESCNR